MVRQVVDVARKRGRSRIRHSEIDRGPDTGDAIGGIEPELNDAIRAITDLCTPNSAPRCHRSRVSLAKLTALGAVRGADFPAARSGRRIPPRWAMGPIRFGGRSTGRHAELHRQPSRLAGDATNTRRPAASRTSTELRGVTRCRERAGPNDDSSKQRRAHVPNQLQLMSVGAGVD